MSAIEPDRLKDAVAIVTGGTSGIGRAVALALARAGSRPVIVGRNAQRVDETIAELLEPSGGAERCLGLALDVGSGADMQRMADAVLTRFGRIDALIASAGILRPPDASPKPLARTATAEWDAVHDINLRGLFLSNRAVLPAMLRQHAGDIINISSVSGLRGVPFDAPYCASKSAMIGMTQSLVEEVSRSGIRVQLVVPDAVATPIWKQNGPVPMPADALPPERVADLIMFMLRLPLDSMLVSPVIAPFRTRRRLTVEASANPPAKHGGYVAAG